MGKLKGILTVVVALVLMTTGLLAQSTTSETPCPSVLVSCSDGRACIDDPYSFLAAVAGASPDLKLSYEWSVVGGRIIHGQGTPQIKVVGNRTRRVVNHDGRWVEEFLLGTVTATVRLTGVRTECDASTASMTILSELNVPPITIVEEFGRLTFRHLKPRLDNFAVALQNNPGAMGYIVSEGNWAFEKRAVEYLVEMRKLNASRVKYVERKQAKELNVKLFLVPAGAVPPRP